MIEGKYEIVIAIYLGILAFFLANWILGNKLLKHSTLNLIFMAFFIIIFFLIGYLFRAILLQLKPIEKNKESAFITTNEPVTYPIES